VRFETRLTALVELTRTNYLLLVFYVCAKRKNVRLILVFVSGDLPHTHTGGGQAREPAQGSPERTS
jgi:hypothetical protein